MSTTPFQSKHQTIRERVIAYILNAADYHPQLPDLDEATWAEVVNWKPQQAYQERLGYGLIRVAISFHISQHFPGLGEGTFEDLRSFIGHSLLFSTLTYGLGIHLKEGAESWRSLPMSHKHLSTVFKTLVFQIYQAHGFRGLRTWTGDLFCPLLDVARDAGLRLKRKMEKSKTQKSKNKETTAHSEISSVATNATLNPPANSFHSSPTARAPRKTMSSSNQLLAKKMLLGTKTTASRASPLLPHHFLVPLQSQGSRFNGYRQIPNKPISVDDHKSFQQIAGPSNLKSLKEYQDDDE
ncbi:hypothetical protein M422DRAFT_241421 [Sphaerobolus stellatus SS14]|nr:hypothetical protein M422DRAFT_241421 [Sphaerobolus stellatus SS14]